MGLCDYPLGYWGQNGGDINGFWRCSRDVNVTAFCICSKWRVHIFWFIPCSQRRSRTWNVDALIDDDDEEIEVFVINMGMEKYGGHLFNLDISSTTWHQSDGMLKMRGEESVDWRSKWIPSSNQMYLLNFGRQFSAH